MTPDELLAQAQLLMERPVGVSFGLWPRAAALLTRSALEGALDEYWQRGSPEVATLQLCTTTTQLYSLPAFLEPPLARRAAYVWHALSAACHHHPYELAPTPSELRAWLEDVSQLLDEVRGRIPS